MRFSDLLRAVVQHANVVQNMAIREEVATLLRQLEAQDAPVLTMEMQIDRLQSGEEQE
jgi:hypothetical protein